MKDKAPTLIDDDFRMDLDKRKPKSIKVSLDKNKKTISVSYYVAIGRIPLKVIAPYSKWTTWEDEFVRHGRLDPNEILSFTTKRTKPADQAALRTFISDSPDIFGFEFYQFYLLEANKLNPKSPIKKPRGGSSHSLSKSEIVRARYHAKHLYIIFHHWLKKPRKKWPKELVKALEALEVKANAFLNPVDATIQTLEAMYGIGLLKYKALLTF